MLNSCNDSHSNRKISFPPVIGIYPIDYVVTHTQIQTSSNSSYNSQNETKSSKVYLMHYCNEATKKSPQVPSSAPLSEVSLSLVPVTAPR